MKAYLSFFLIILLSAIFDCYGQVSSPSQQLMDNNQDSIIIWINLSKEKDLSLKKRKYYLDNAYRYTLNELNDTILNALLLKISYAYYDYGDSTKFRTVNRRSINLSKELKDSVSLAANYWDLGIFFARNEIKDSAYFNYFKAQKIYESINNNFYSGRLLLNMAIIQTDLKDYTGSEITTFKALELLKPLDKYDQLYRCYNNLGIIYNELEDFEQSLIYHNEALGYEKKIKESNTFKANTLNNIGVVYERQKNLREALKNYQLAIAEQNLKNKNSELFARILGNIAYSKFLLRDTSGIKNIFYKALRIRDSVNDLSGISINKIQLAEYYSFNKDTLQAIKLAKEASDLSFRTNNFRDQLASFLLLSKLDKKNSSHYANKYIVLSDKLVKQERSVRNKFARIQFETDEYISENERLYEQRKRLLMLSFAGLILAILSYIIIDQRHKNIKLRLEARQQKANEEIYDLMLVQQYKLDEGRRKEKKRISEELHDGVLGKLFGTRLLLSALNDKSDAKNIKKREKYIIDLQAVEEEVRSVSHELSRQSEFLNVGYKQVVQDLLENQSKISSFNYEFRCDKKINWEEISGEFKMNMYRIIQESLQNINKYAKAKNVMVEFKLTQKHLKLLIIDDGIGFNTSIKKKGIGLKNIKSRTKHLKGIFKIKSESSSGTFIEIKIPYLGDLIF